MHVEEVLGVGYRGLAVLERCEDIESADSQDDDPRRERAKNGKRNGAQPGSK